MSFELRKERKKERCWIKGVCGGGGVGGDTDKNEEKRGQKVSKTVVISRQNTSPGKDTYSSSVGQAHSPDSATCN